MDLSNKTLAMFLIAAIVISLAGTILSFNRLNKITGASTTNTSGNVTLTVQTQGGLVFTQNLIAWGSGYVNTSNGNQRCNITTWTQPNYAGNGCIGFTSTNLNLTMENQGNVPLQILYNASANATGFLGGTMPSFTIDIRNATTRAGCDATMNTTWQNLSGTTGGYVAGTQLEACAQLNYSDTKDRLDLIVNITFAYDVTQTAKSVIIQAQGVY